MFIRYSYHHGSDCPYCGKPRLTLPSWWWFIMGLFIAWGWGR